MIKMKLKFEDGLNLKFALCGSITGDTEIREMIKGLLEDGEVNEGDFHSAGGMMVLCDFIERFKSGKVKNMDVSVWRKVCDVKK